MRRSTAAAVGTLAGAALIVGVRLSVSAPDVAAAPPAADPGAASLAPTGRPAPASRKPSRPAAGKRTAPAPTARPSRTPDAGESPGGLRSGVFQGAAVRNPYGTIQVSITVAGGRITAADATFPLTGDSARINPPAIAQLKQQTLRATGADDVDAVSGATFTSESYTESLQAALDAAGA